MTFLDHLESLPEWLNALLIVGVISVGFLIKPGVTAWTEWRKTRAVARKIDTETDLKLIAEYKLLLKRFEEAIEEQKAQNKKLSAENQHLRQTAEQLLDEARTLHEMVKKCIDRLHDEGVPTGEMPVVPDFKLIEKRRNK